MNVIERIDELMKARKWSDYRLAQESGLSQSTIANIRRRHSLPSIPTLESICDAFGISLAQFFTENTFSVQLNSEQMEFFDSWVSLTDEQKLLCSALIKEFNKSK